MKKVLVKHSFYLWEDWEDEYATKEHIEFYYNEGTSCADNIISKILKNKRNKFGERSNFQCTCHMQESEVVEIKD